VSVGTERPFQPRFTYTHIRIPPLSYAILLAGHYANAVKSTPFFARKVDRLVSAGYVRVLKAMSKGGRSKGLRRLPRLESEHNRRGDCQLAEVQVDASRVSGRRRKVYLDAQIVHMERGRGGSASLVSGRYPLSSLSSSPLPMSFPKRYKMRSLLFNLFSLQKAWPNSSGRSANAYHHVVDDGLKQGTGGNEWFAETYVFFGLYSR